MERYEKKKVYQMEHEDILNTSSDDTSDSSCTDSSWDPNQEVFDS